ncbi:hypothetical protein B0T25DRAFT_584500 [Lasiosphaeria hispida]|uniref:Jacalin-type lectin domain-containing protein n=1 Tax=Lasiosphaeria hispida TaxID=260671 RepID=A0AAJ0M988_9PEZI|nr:hypothetical protein B0T25DRAFT_584500 [Lasiosphaeria hispida]
MRPCLMPKGFTFMRVAIAVSGDSTTAVYANFYNLHTDAGTETAHNAARQANVNQVELERSGTVPTVETLCANPSTIDSCETVDKIFFYRSGPLVTLQDDDFTYASKLFLQADGSVLLDHNPVMGNFYTVVGDVPVLAGIAKAKTPVLTFRGGSRLDGFGLTLTDGTRFTHGGTGGSPVTLTLGASERWVAAKLCQGQKDGNTRIFSIRAVTSSGRSLAAGMATGDCVRYPAPSGWQIVGFLDGSEVD